MSRRSKTPDETQLEGPRGFDDYELRLGDIMRGERATLGKSLLDVQRDLKIKATYIAAIENADPSAFESPGFVAGYVRSYARYLNLDPEWAYKSFCEEGAFEGAPSLGASQMSVKPKKAKRPGLGAKQPAASAPKGFRDPLAEPSVSFIPAGEKRLSTIEPGAIMSVTVLVALIAAIGYGGWTVLQEVQKVTVTPVDQTPGVLAQLDPVRPAFDPATDAPESADVAAAPAEALDRLYRPEALDVPVLVARDGPIATINPGSVGVLATPAPPDPRDPMLGLRPPEVPGGPALAGAAPEALPEAGEAAESAVQVVAEAPPSVELFAVRPSWVRVRAADGTVIFEKILDAGERFVLPKTEEPPTLRAGNAGSLYFALGDETFGPAGQGAGVIRDVALSVENVTTTYALADPSEDADLARFVAVAEAQGEAASD